MQSRLFLALALFGCAAPAPAEHQEPIVGGTVDTGDPAVGVLIANDPTGGWLCSGTLITPTVFLTAAHCVQPATSQTTFQVSFQTDYSQATDWTTASEAHYNPAFDMNNLTAGHDCAVLLFANPITTATPKPFNEWPLLSSMIGQPVRVVGYGNSDAASSGGAGIKRQLSDNLHTFSATDIILGGPGHTICHGDSGGPLFMTMNGVETLIGITSYTANSDGCTTNGDEARVDVCAAWINQFIPDSMPPTVSVTAPHAGDTVPSTFEVDFDASDDHVVLSVDLLADGQMVGTTLGPPPWKFQVAGGAIAAGSRRLSAVAHDGHGNQAQSGEVTVTVKKLGDTPGDLGTHCAADTDCTGGAMCSAGLCTRVCSAGAPCPSGFACESTANFTQQCRPTASDDSGCSAVPSGRAASPWLLLVAVSAWLVRRRSCRRSLSSFSG